MQTKCGIMFGCVESANQTLDFYWKRGLAVSSAVYMVYSPFCLQNGDAH